MIIHKRKRKNLVKFSKIDYSVTTIINDVAPTNILIHFSYKFDIYFTNMIKLKISRNTYIQFTKNKTIIN